MWQTKLSRSPSRKQSSTVFPFFHAYEQTAYELLRFIVLFGDPATKRAEETSEPRPTLERKADAFDEQGMNRLMLCISPSSLSPFSGHVSMECR